MELKPCPFCGCKTVLLFDDEYGRAITECDDCAATGPTRYTGVGDQDHRMAEAVRLWNTRHDD